MPVLFIGHGNPMNVIGENIFKDGWKNIAEKISTPNAILCISAHWLSDGTYVSVMDNPSLIYDFSGFPDELYHQEYSVKGAPSFAEMLFNNIQNIDIKKNYTRGLDHGVWTILKSMFPLANIPVFQLSIDYKQSTEFHFNLGREIAFLRKKGVLIIASGNIVHNLELIRFNKNEKPFSWAIEFDDFVKKCLENKDFNALIEYEKFGKSAQIAHPTNDHFLPLLYAAGCSDINDEVFFFNELFDLGVLSMRCVVFY